MSHAGGDGFSSGEFSLIDETEDVPPDSDALCGSAEISFSANRIVLYNRLDEAA